MKNQEHYGDIEVAFGNCALDYLIDNLHLDSDQSFDDVDDFNECVSKIGNPTVLADLFFAARVIIDSDMHCASAGELLIDAICRQASAKFANIVDTCGTCVVCYTDSNDALEACDKALSGASEVNDETVRLAFSFAMHQMTDNVSVEAFIGCLLDEENWPVRGHFEGTWLGLPKYYIGEAYKTFVFKELRKYAEHKKYSSNNYFSGPYTLVDPVIELSTDDVWDKVTDYLPLFSNWTTGGIDARTQMQGYPPITYATLFKCMDWREVWQRHRDGQYGLVRKESN